LDDDMATVTLGVWAEEVLLLDVLELSVVMGVGHGVVAPDDDVALFVAGAAVTRTEPVVVS
jgi:hypothetical protein